MQYFGYLRRNPDDAPDSDYTGYDFWLQKLGPISGYGRESNFRKAIVRGIQP